MAKNRYFPKVTTPVGAIQSDDTTADEVVQDTTQVVESESEEAVDTQSSQEPVESIIPDPAPDVAIVKEVASESVVEASGRLPEMKDFTFVPELLSTPSSVTEAPITPTEKEKTDMNIQHQLDTYAENMALGKPVAPKDGGMHQYTLFKLIKTILDTEDQAEFTTKFNTLLGFARDQATKVFSESYVYRFPDQWPGSESEYTNFRRILMVIILTADAQKRKLNLTTLDMGKALSGFSEKQKNRLIVFFGL